MRVSDPPGASFHGRRYPYRAAHGWGPDLTATPHGRYGQLFRTPSFRPLLAAGALQFAAPSTALVILLYRIAFAYPHSDPTSYVALALTLFGLSSALPTLAGALFSGPLADRHDRGRLMRLANLASIVATAGLAVDLYLSPAHRLGFPGPAGFYLPLWIVLALPGWALLAASSTIFRPAFNTAMPRLVETSELGRANGVIYSTAAAASGVGTVASGVALALGAGAYAFAIPLLLFVGAQVSLLGVRANLAVERREPTRSVTAEMVEGFRYLVHRIALFEMTLGALVINFLTAVALVELALYLANWLSVSDGFWYGAMVATATAGSACGLFAAAHLRFEERAGRLMIALVFVTGLAIAALALVRSIYLALPIIFVYGFAPGAITTVFLSVVQATVPDEKMGRVFAADEVGSLALVPFGQIAGGLLTIVVGVRGTYLLAGTGIVIFGVVMLTMFAALRRLGYRPGKRESPPGQGPADRGGEYRDAGGVVPVARRAEGPNEPYPPIEVHGSLVALRDVEEDLALADGPQRA
jgi:MFS family permease